MKKIIIKTPNGKSIITCGEGAFSSLADRLSGRRLFVITDTNVDSLYSGLIAEKFGGVEKFVFAAGEESKTPQTLFAILNRMIEVGLHRNDTVVAFGGGVVGDIAGLAASLYMRGVRLVQVPTTLLAQVDSSVGGKTAVDMRGIKNVIGTFYQPEEVAADPLFFKTLPVRETRCGLGEIIKYGALSKKIYEKLCADINNLPSNGFTEDIVFDCIAHKAEVVENDEHDLNGLRKSLNLGHTTGHALELFYGGLPHGVFVLIGMYYELYIAQNLNICGGQYIENLKNLILSVIGNVPFYDDVAKAAEFAVYDKKNEKGSISLVIPESEGQWTEIKVKKDEYVNFLVDCAQKIREKLW
jgi:3-dehydroquinate synthase